MYKECYWNIIEINVQSIMETRGEVCNVYTYVRM